MFSNFMWYWTFLLPFPISHSFGHDFWAWLAWVKTTSQPYLVSLCLGQHPSLSFYSFSHTFSAKDKYHHHCTLPEQQQHPSPVQASVQGAWSSLSQGCSGAEQGQALQLQLLVGTCRLVRHKSGAKTVLRNPYADFYEPSLQPGSTWHELCSAYHNSHSLSGTLVELSSLTGRQDFL